MPWFRSVCVLLLLSFTPILADDWPQWLGPKRDGSTKEIVTPWEGKLRELWKQPVGEGHSSPVVANGVVFLHTKDREEDKEVVQALDAKSGKVLWSSSYDRRPYKGLFGNGPRATPTVKNGKVFTFGITGTLACFDSKTGKEVWKIDTEKEFNAPKLFFGSSCSPLVADDRVIMNIGGKGTGLMAFAMKNGKVLWKNLDDGPSYASGIATKMAGAEMAVFLTKNGVVAVAVGDGKELWRFPFIDALAESSTTPVRMKNMIIASAITKGSVGLKISKGKESPNAEKQWITPDLTCYFATPVPCGKDLYMVTGTKPPALVTKATLHCVDPKTGKSLWQRPGVGKYHASLLRTGDNKMLILEEKGDLVLFDPSSEGYKELARANICGNTWAHAAISDGRLYIRDGRFLRCIQLPTAKK